MCSCGSPSGLPRSNSLLMTRSSMRAGEVGGPGQHGGSFVRNRGLGEWVPPEAVGLLAYEVTEDGGGDRARSLVESQVGCATDDGPAGSR